MPTAFPREEIKRLILDLVVNPLLEKAQEFATHGYPAYIAARSDAPDDGIAKPVMAALLPPAMVIGSAIERSFVTSFGWRMDTILTRIAAANYSFASGGKGRYVGASGQLPVETIATIDKLIADMASKTKAAPSQASEIAAIEASFARAAGEMQAVGPIRIDVYFLDKETGIEYALESKTQKPDKGQLKDAKLDALKLLALKRFPDSELRYENAKSEDIPTGTSIKPLMCTYYNPWGILVDAKFPTFDTWFERHTQFLVGKETWTLVGRSKDTYDCFMSVLWEIHKETKGQFERIADLRY